MKTIYFILVMLFLSWVMSSCSGNKDYSVMLDNRAVVLAYDTQDRSYSIGDTVCMWKPDAGDHKWKMDTQGYMISDASTRIGIVTSVLP